MPAPTRRAFLAGAAAIAAAAPYDALWRVMPEGSPVGAVTPAAGSGAAAAASADVYASNTALYSDTRLVEGTDYARRYKRHVMFDDDSAQRFGFAKTTVIAPHGGGIEGGTSELCLAVAGYDPATLSVNPTGGPAYDYWMLEGVRRANNAELHVTSTHCDDAIALSLCGGARNAIALHGCTVAAAGLPKDAEAVLVGGRNGTFKRYLIGAISGAGFTAVEASNGSLDGDEPENITNRTLLGAGGQLEITKPLREKMFETNTVERRRHTTTPDFWRFVTATRAAIARLETGQPVL